ncbi:hypothetical protein GCM10009844_02360 [Nocardioides koreensis]|uniref:WD40 repeat domain-containing protein n=1 Tax=Nocardioides koreensis TaxID=433651 RepID=A0ABN2Z3I1_9ACTN
MSTQDPMTDEVVRELRHRADALYDAPLSFTDVRGRAHRIRRRRRATAAAAVAAAVAVVAVVPAVLSGSLDRADGPDPAPTPSRAGHTAVLHDGRVTLPDGSTVGVDLDNADVTQLGLLTDGRIVAATSRPQAIQVFSPDGDLEARYRVPVNAITMSPDDDLVAWADDSHRVEVLESGVAEPVALSGIPLPGETVPTIDAVTGSDCAAGGCTVYAGDGTTTSATATLDGARDLTAVKPLRITDVSPDGRLWAVQLPHAGSVPQLPCAGLYDPEADRVVARNCNYASNLDFSPDGQYLTAAEGDNNMVGKVDVFDLGLERVGTWQPPGSQVVSRYAWADATHLLAATVGLEDNQWSLVRVALDFGDPEVLAGPVAGRNPEILSEFLPSE